jgi:hypothetical protein
MRKHRRQFDTSVEASGPHGFAVRVRAVRQERIRVHRIPHPTFCDDRETPLLWGTGRREVLKMICPTAQGKIFKPVRPICPTELREIFFGAGLDSPNQIELLRKICVFAHPIAMASRSSRRSVEPT